MGTHARDSVYALLTDRATIEISSRTCAVDWWRVRSAGLGASGRLAVAGAVRPEAGCGGALDPGLLPDVWWRRARL